MSAPAVFEGSYADLKLVKSRGACQVIIEIPLEAATAFVAAFGMPNPSAEIPVALARLQEPAPEPARLPAPEKRKLSDLPPAQRAALLCSREAFWKYCFEQYPNRWRKAYERIDDDEQAAAQFVRQWCEVKSRREIKEGTEAERLFMRLEAKFDAWFRVPVL